MTETLLRSQAEAIVAAGIDAADPQRLVEADIQHSGAASWRWLMNARRLHVLAVGKAAHAMTEGALTQLPGRPIESGLVVSHLPVPSDRPRVMAMVGDHPHPGRRSMASARQVMRMVAALDGDDGLLVLLSGGGSALVTMPADGLTLDDKRRMTELLLASGAPIAIINAIRKHLSLVKGGLLARMAAPARVLVLVLSDIPGGDVGMVASGPFSPDPVTYGDALTALDRYDLLARAPRAVLGHLRRGADRAVAETPKPGDRCFETVVVREIGGNAASVRAMSSLARRNGFDTPLFPFRLDGEARDAAEHLVGVAERQWRLHDGRSLALVAGGETTVTLSGTGTGGRNQEFALAFALAAARRPLPFRWVLACCGSDGRDGPTDAAGAVVDPQSLTRMRAAGADPAHALADNDSHAALAAAGDLLRTGPTGTNVADFAVLLMDHPSDRRPGA